jgi:hypothetical protein
MHFSSKQIPTIFFFEKKRYCCLGTNFEFLKEKIFFFEKKTSSFKNMGEIVFVFFGKQRKMFFF